MHQPLAAKRSITDTVTYLILDGKPSGSNTVGVPRSFDRGRHPTVMLDPCPGRRRNPSGYIENALVVRGQVPRKNRFVMGNPVAQDPESIERMVSLPANQFHAVHERPAERRPSQCHLVIRLAPVFSPTTGSQQRHPEPERKRRHDPRWISSTPVTRELRLDTRDPPCGAPVEARARMVVPYRAVTFGEPAVHGVAQNHFQSLQWPVEGGADRGVPSMEPDRPFPISPNSVEIGAQTRARAPFPVRRESRPCRRRA